MQAFGLVIPAIENRKIIAVSFTSRKFPGRAPEGRILLRTFLGGAMQPELMALSDSEMIAVVKTELSEILGVTGEPDFMEVVRYENAMPQYHVGHLDRVSRIETLAAKHTGLQLAGNAYRGVG
ncbi:MAG: protoporphyrinogen oxidase, partial [Proteobacteria bacterium]|nr:protoporphyrinogen oxidase [Pseudomonadota bacterium]